MDKEGGGDGLSLGSHCDGDVDPLGSDRHRIRIERRMALAGRCPWNWGSFPEHQERICLGHNDHRDLNSGCPLLFHPSFDSCVCQGLFPTCSSHCDRVPLASEI